MGDGWVCNPSATATLLCQHLSICVQPVLWQDKLAAQAEANKSDAKVSPLLHLHGYMFEVVGCFVTLKFACVVAFGALHNLPILAPCAYALPERNESTLAAVLSWCYLRLA